MDMEDAAWQDKLKVLRLMYEKGELSSETSSKLRDRLDMIVDEELSKPAESINNEFVDACTDLMGVLSGRIYHSRASYKRKNWRVLQKRLGIKVANPFKRLIPAFGIVMIFIISLFVADAVLPMGKVVTYSTPDEQLYIVEGKETRQMLMPSAMASLDEDDVLSINTVDIGEVDAFFGFTPPMPQNIPNGWETDHYEGHISQAEWMFLLVLSNEAHEHTTTYHIVANTMYDGVKTAYHQNEKGTPIKLPNKMDGYFSYNTDDTIVVWQDGLTNYSVSGPVTLEEALNLVETIN
jgi:hypothetical protein